jgi:hypothetical protein
LPTQPALWDRISAYELEAPFSNFSFMQRLRQETGWAADFADAAVEEYKKFIYLLCISDRPLSPSPEIDQVWHAHMLWTENYWEKFCEGTIGRKVHHRPSSEGVTPALRADYDATLDLYADEFGEAAPRDFWPNAGERKPPLLEINPNQYLPFVSSMWKSSCWRWCLSGFSCWRSIWKSPRDFFSPS